MNNSCVCRLPSQTSPLLLLFLSLAPYLSSKPQIYRLRRHYSLYHLSRHNLLLLEHPISHREKIQFTE